MKNTVINKPLGVLPLNTDVAVSLMDEYQNTILESYVYIPGYFRFNWHASLEILFVLRGKITVYTENGLNEAKEDDIILINNSIAHASMIQDPNTVIALIHISSSFLENECGFSPIFKSHVDSIKNFASARIIRSCFANIYLALAKSSSLENQLLAKSQTYLLISVLLKDFVMSKEKATPSPKETAKQKRVHETARYIGRYFREKITLKDLADFSGMNPSYLSVFFKNELGIGFHEYLTRKRVEYAVYIINNSDREDTLLEIALDSGFPDIKAFNNAFRKYFNLSPGQYRKIKSKNHDSNVSSHRPIRLSLDDPFVVEKLKSYDMLFGLSH